jgi:phosphoribosylaminoimidazolecarboxamide formyltransferase/IMP cyclohydrolase
MDRIQIRQALISVSDKTGIVEFASRLNERGVEIISTGGTATTLRQAGINVKDVSEVTGFPEMMDGRVKTLHPRIHGGLLGVRENPEHVEAMRAHGIKPIDMVVVNLYPFQQTVAKPGVKLEDAIEQIDIGGPAMLRSAAKNYASVAVVTSPEAYAGILDELMKHDGGLSLATRQKLALDVFKRTFEYDSAISNYLEGAFAGESRTAKPDRPVEFPQTMNLVIEKVSDLRYGENPHQQAALYMTGQGKGVATARILGGKEMSFNNYVDADAAWELVREFDSPTCAIIKHTNPAGAALGATLEEAYRRALETDPVSAFGGIVAFNGEVDAAASRAVTEIFTEVVIAPAFAGDALEILRGKKNLRVLAVTAPDEQAEPVISTISGGFLVQTPDNARIDPSTLRFVTERHPDQAELESLLFAWKVCKHTKSNAIVYARDGQTVGVGAGQMSRVDSVRLGAMRARVETHGSALASDAFFPFRDGIDEAAKFGVTSIIQPGGSVRDEEVIAAANEHGIAMVFTGVRHFRH